MDSFPCEFFVVVVVVVVAIAAKKRAQCRSAPFDSVCMDS